MFQDNQRSSLKALSTGVSDMQEQEEIDRGHLSVLQAQVLNITAKSTQVSMSTFSTLFQLLLQQPLALLLLLLLQLLLLKQLLVPLLILLSQWDRVYFKKLKATSQEISSFHEIQRFTTVFTTASHCSTSLAR
jgi:hypothetical protein